MKNVNNLIKHIHKDNTSKPKTHTCRWSSNTQKAMLGLFARFGDLYGELARSKGLEIKREGSSELTREFQLWCLKLDDIDMEGIARGVELLEKRIITNSSQGVKSWPPSYAEFKGLCIKPAAKACHKDYVPLPAPTLSNDEKKDRMAALRKGMGL